MKPWTGIILSLFTLNAYATIYVSQQSNGDIIYSDTPMENAKIVNLPEEAKKPVATTEDTTKKPEQMPAIAIENYKTFRITAPVDQQTIQNQPELLIDFAVDPALKDNHKIQVFIDGARIGAPTTDTHFNAGLVERGAHEVYGLIVDKENHSKMQSNVITIFIQQAHTGAPKKLPTSSKKITPIEAIIQNLIKPLG